jgi:hypothetical protein
MKSRSLDQIIYHAEPIPAKKFIMRLEYGLINMII